jgi:hypothetical protein
MSGFNSDIPMNESIEFGSFSKPFLSLFYTDFISVKMLRGNSNKKSHVNEVKLSSA